MNAAIKPAVQVRGARFSGGGGLTLVADIAGNMAAPAIVLLPGAGQTRHSWRQTFEALAARDHALVSLDLRGHGESGWAPDGDYSIDAFIADIKAVLTALPAPPVVVGASIGGIAALIAIGEAGGPDVSGLVLVDVVPGMPREGLDRIRGFMTAGANGFANLEEAADAVANYLPHRPRRDDHQGLKKNLRHGADGRLYWHWDPAFHAGSVQRAQAGMLERMRAAAAGVRVPTLLISGARSEVVDRAGAEQLLQLIPQAEWINVRDAAHMVAGDRNDAFYAGIENFIERVLPAATSGYR